MSFVRFSSLYTLPNVRYYTTKLINDRSYWCVARACVPFTLTLCSKILWPKLLLLIFWSRLAITLWCDCDTIYITYKWEKLVEACSLVALLSPCPYMSSLSVLSFMSHCSACASSQYAIWTRHASHVRVGQFRTSSRKLWWTLGYIGCVPSSISKWHLVLISHNS